MTPRKADLTIWGATMYEKIKNEKWAESVQFVGKLREYVNITN